MKKAISYIFLLLLVLSACTTVIKVDVPQGSKFVVVDAFIDDKPQPQKVRLTFTADYFSNQPTPPVLGAGVSLNDLSNNKTYTFTPDNNGNYFYTPLSGDTMMRVGHQYQLTVSYNGNTYFAFSTLNRTTTIDSVRFTGNIDPTSTHGDTGRYHPLLFARDAPGATDYYWLKIYKNGQRYELPDGIDISQDAGGVNTDGQEFDDPVAKYFIYPHDSVFHYGQLCTIEVLSVNANTYDYLLQLNLQLTNSQAGLFAVTPENVRTNIQQSAGTQKAIGWFNMGSSVSKTESARKELIVTPR